MISDTESRAEAQLSLSHYWWMILILSLLLLLSSQPAHG